MISCVQGMTKYGCILAENQWRGLWKWDLPVQFHEPLTAFPRNPESPHLVGAKGDTDALFPLLIPEVGIKRSEFHLWQVPCEIYWNAGRNLSFFFLI